MKFFPVLKTQRLTVQMNELTMSEAVKVASVPAHLNELTCTTFLRLACFSIEGIPDPAQWTVNERIFAVAHYIASVSSEGANFSVGDGHYLDYLDASRDRHIEQMELCELEGDHWSIRPLTGAMTEAIEQLVGELDIPGRLHWILGGMAAQLVSREENKPDGEQEYGVWLLERMKTLASFPESLFEQLMTAYFIGMDQLACFFDINFDDKGIVIMPGKGAEGDLPPARFPCLSYLTRSALILARRFD